MHESHLPVLARTMRGIESIARDEVRSRLGVEAHIGHRELCFSAPLTPALLQLGTVDDLFVVLGELEGVTRRREALARVAGFRADLDAVARLLGRPGGRSFDVTASFLGRRNYNRFELEDALVPDAAWTRVARDGRLSLRIHAAEGLATVAVRIASRPLHRRAYRVATVPGSLHPPLARALALLAGGLFVDPFCGAGTIPIEGALAGIESRGSDRDLAAVEAARRNASAAGLAVPFTVRDAASLGAVERVVTNPPWGKAVRPAGAIRFEAQRVVTLSAERVVASGIVFEQPVRVHGALARITVVER